jgi:hypothetical protein
VQPGQASRGGARSELPELWNRYRAQHAAVAERFAGGDSVTGGKLAYTFASSAEAGRLQGSQQQPVRQ